MLNVCPKPYKLSNCYYIAFSKNHNKKIQILLLSHGWKFESRKVFNSYTKTLNCKTVIINGEELPIEFRSLPPFKEEIPF